MESYMEVMKKEDTTKCHKLAFEVWVGFCYDREDEHLWVIEQKKKQIKLCYAEMCW